MSAAPVRAVASTATHQAETILDEQILDLGRQGLRISAVTFYVRDPWWTDEFRLLLMPGVKVREPMYGFLDLSTEGEDEI